MKDSDAAQAQKKTTRRIALAVGAVSLFAVVAALGVASRLGGDEAVMADIDRHFKQVEEASGTRPHEDVSSDAVLDLGQASWATGALASKHQSKGKVRSSKKSGAKGGASDATAAGQTGWTGIRRIDDRTFAIDNRLAADARKSPGAYIKGVVARLVGRGGQPLGFELSGVGPASPLFALGLRDKDVLLAVNGFSLKSLDEALLAATSLRFASRYRVDIERSQKKQSFYYRIEGE